jgi:predicted nucleotidyltransferase
MNASTAALAAAKAVLRDDPRIAVAFAFGSVAALTAKPESDLDVAVWRERWIGG